MITLALQGRTGNNLFQYAAGRALALRRNTDLVLDGSWVNAAHAMPFREIFQFPIAATYRDSGRLAKQLLRAARINPARFHRGAVYDEQDHTFDSSVLDLPDGILLRGSFQSPRYFQEIEEVLRTELDLTHARIPKASEDFEALLRARQAVSIHVRRGDYLNISATQCLNEDYHDKAIEWFRKRLADPVFCVFSDDIPWCRTRFTGEEFLFCDLPGSNQSPLHDLRLMAACRHHVIVNSSYSWWAAWLNPSADKVVVAPSMWMTDFPSTSLLLPDWITI